MRFARASSQETSNSEGHLQCLRKNLSLQREERRRLKQTDFCGITVARGWGRSEARLPTWKYKRRQHVVRLGTGPAYIVRECPSTSTKVSYTVSSNTSDVLRVVDSEN